MNKILHLAIFLILLNSVISETISLEANQQGLVDNIPLTAEGQLVTTEPQNHAEWRNAITAGVSRLSKKGTPGQAIVFGMNASVIAVGDSINDVLISAGEVGNGRVVVMTQSSYGDNFTAGRNSDASVRTLHANIKDWLMRGEFYNSSFIMEAQAYLKSTNATAKRMVKILHSTEPVVDWTSRNITSVLSFVRNGGGLFVSATPWGWASIKQSNNFNLMLTYRTLLEAGIAFNGNYIWGSSVFYFNKVTHLSHLGIQVDITLAPENPQFNYSNTVKVMDQAQHLPINVVRRFQKKINLYLTRAEVRSNAPSESTKTRSAYIKTRLLCYQRFFLNGNFNIVAPKHENFPGAVNKSAENFQYVSREFTFTAPNFEQFHHTGLYAVPGQAVTIEVLSALPNSTWQVFIGFHTDNNINHESWVRWPTVFTRRDLVRNTTFSCGFGGLIYLINPSGTNETIRIKVGPAVEAPWYDSRDQASIEDWPTRKNAVGAWGCAQGKWVAFCMPRASFASVDPLQVLNTYDEIQVEYNTLRGTNPEDERKRYILADIMPSVGYMHNGYPIVTQLDVATPNDVEFQFNQASLTTNGHWGLFHELGHNMQRGWWTPQGTGEVTVNIFSLKADQMILGKTPKQSPWLIDQKQSAQNYLLSPNFNTWKKNPGIALMIYAQVIEDFGWDSMRNVMTSYETGDSATYPTSEQGIIDFFWSQYSLQVEVDLSELLQKWDIPFTSDFTSRVEGLPAYVERVNLFAP